MASEPTIQYAEKIADLTLNGLVKKGDLLAHNGTNWVQADATDAATNLYAQYLAMQGGASGTKIKGCKGCVLYDADTPYTANGTIYTSGTAGAHTQTRPAVDGDVIQVVGRAISTTEARFDIKAPEEVDVFYQTGPFNRLASGNTDSETIAVDATTDEWVGAEADQVAVAAVFAGWFPSNMIGNPLVAELVCNQQNSTAIDLDVTYVRAYVGATNTGDAGATQTSLTGGTTATDNLIQKVSIIDGMDADFSKAGAAFSLSVDVDAGDFLLIGLHMRYLVV